MDEYEALRGDIRDIAESFTRHTTAQLHMNDEMLKQHERLWADNAELRDEINAVANRVESLTRAVMADPSEVAQAIVNDANRSTLREVDGRQT